MMVLDIEKLLFGIEEEFFLFDHNGIPPSHEVIDQLYAMLVNTGCEPLSFRSSNTPSTVLLKKGTHSLAIKNEYCTHILELAFSPLTQVSDFRILWETAFEVLLPIFEDLDLKITPGAVLATIPKAIIRPNDTDPGGLRLQELIDRPSTGKPLFHQHIFATICSTQINIGIAWDEIRSKLDNLYAYEFLFPLLFSNGTVFQEYQFHAMRPLIMQDNFGAEYGKVGFPSTLAKEDSPAKSVSRSYAYIADRGNRVEFRSTDCQGDCEKIVKIVKLRRLILSAAMQTELKPPLTISHNRFFQACQGNIELGELLDMLRSINAPEKLRDFVETLVREIVSQKSGK